MYCIQKAIEKQDCNSEPDKCREVPMLGPNAFLSPNQCRRCGLCEELEENKGTGIYHWGSQCPHKDKQGNLPPVPQAGYSQKMIVRVVETEVKSLGVHIQSLGYTGNKQVQVTRMAKEAEQYDWY